MPVAIPIRDVHIQFDIAFQDLLTVQAEGSMHEIGTRLAIPEAELNDLDERTGESAEGGSERAGVPHGLPFQLSPFFGKMTARFAQEGRSAGASLLVDGLANGRG